MGSVPSVGPDQALLTFSTTYAASYGDRLYVCGSARVLGAWKLAAAVPLKWHANDLWTADVEFTRPVANVPARLEYKFFVSDSKSPDPSLSSREPLWEPGDNHAVDLVPGTANATLPHAWGDGGSHDIPAAKAGSAVSRPKPHLAAASPPPTPAPLASGLVTGPVDPVTLAVERLASSSSSISGESLATSPVRVVPVVFRVSVPAMGRQPDDALYVVGSCPALGSWNKAHSPRMRCVKEARGSVQRCDAADGVHDTWQVSMMLPLDSAHKRFEYKYLVRTHGVQRVWEPGPNRLAAVHGDAVLPGMIWDDRWDRTRCEFSIFYPVDDGSVMHITGDPVEIGGWFKPGPVPLELGDVERLETDVDGRKWQLVVWMPRSVTCFGYRYILVNQSSKTSLWEREPNRYADFLVQDKKDDTEVTGSANGLRLVGADSNRDGKPTENNPVNGVQYLKDVNFVTSMKFDAVPPDMFIGPYPQTPEDVDALADAGATAVFNVQTDEDFKHRGIKWDDLVKRYKERHITVVRFPIRDFDRDSLALHLHAAAHELNRLIDGGKKVYIHCTAGMGRAPACAVAYLCWARGYALQEAVCHVKKHRPVAVPNVPVLEKALKRPF